MSEAATSEARGPSMPVACSQAGESLHFSIMVW